MNFPFYSFRDFQFSLRFGKNFLMGVESAKLVIKTNASIKKNNPDENSKFVARSGEVGSLSGSTLLAMAGREKDLGFKLICLCEVLKI